MKNILLLAFLMLFVNINAQFNKKNYGLSENEFKNFISEIIQTTGKPFVLSKTDENKGYVYYTYINSDNKDDDLIISTIQTGEGFNAALEVKGVLVWNISKISGKFLSLFPIWKKYVDPGADKVKMSNGGVSFSPMSQDVNIRENNGFDNFWSLYLPLREAAPIPKNTFGIEW